MTSTSTSTISPRQTSLLNLDNWIGELELAITEDATQTVLTLTKQIERAAREPPPLRGRSISTCCADKQHALFPDQSPAIFSQFSFGAREE